MQTPHSRPQPTGVVRCLTATAARKNLYQLIADTNQDGVPVHVTSPRGNAVIVSEDDWNAIQETLYLSSIPGMVDRLRRASTAPDDEFVDASEVEL